MIDKQNEYTACLKCGGVVEAPPDRFCAACVYPGIHDDFEEFIGLIEDGYTRHQAAVMSGWIGAEEI